jgi:hypothetical protein
MLSQNRVLLIPLLGSYDRETKSILNIVKEEIAKYSTSFTEYIMPLLLEDVEIYYSTTAEIVVEKFNDRATAMIFENDQLKDIRDFDARTLDDVEKELKRLGYSCSRLPVMGKLLSLAQNSFLVFLIRHKELTRGGEYIELCFLLLKEGLSPSKVYIFIKNDIEISAMLEELIDATKINLRPYRDEEHLAETVRRVIYYEIREPGRKV